MVKQKKNKKSLIAKLKEFFTGVKEERKKVIWTSKKNLVKYSIATLLFMLFICLFFVATDLVIAGITKVKDMQENIFRVIVPERKEVEIKDGKKKEKMKKLFPGYVLVEMIMSDESWYIVRNTPGVTGFLGSSGKGAKPVPLYDDEVERIFKEIGYTGENVVTNYEVGDNVKITDGPFKMLAGKITELDLDAKKANVSIDLFGQETNVELELTQFTKE